MQDDDELDEGFAAFESTIRPRSVLDVEHKRIGRGHAPDEVLLRHGEAADEDILRALEREVEARRGARHAAEILEFPAGKKPEGA